MQYLDTDLQGRKAERLVKVIHAGSEVDVVFPLVVEPGKEFFVSARAPKKIEYADTTIPSGMDVQFMVSADRKTITPSVPEGRELSEDTIEELFTVGQIIELTAADLAKPSRSRQYDYSSPTVIQARGLRERYTFRKEESQGQVGQEQPVQREEHANIELPVPDTEGDADRQRTIVEEIRAQAAEDVASVDSTNATDASEPAEPRKGLGLFGRVGSFFANLWPLKRAKTSDSSASATNTAVVGESSHPFVEQGRLTETEKGDFERKIAESIDTAVGSNNLINSMLESTINTDNGEYNITYDGSHEGEKRGSVVVSHGGDTVILEKKYQRGETYARIRSGDRSNRGIGSLNMNHIVRSTMTGHELELKPPFDLPSSKRQAEKIEKMVLAAQEAVSDMALHTKDLNRSKYIIRSKGSQDATYEPREKSNPTKKGPNELN